jgi:general secretion pathway protein C
LNPELGDIDKGVNCTGNACTVDRALVEKLLSNTTMLATAARFVPSIKDGKPNGFKLYAIRPQSIFGRIGLQNGDTIKAINGSEMTTPDAALGLYTKLRNASHLSVQVERRGETVTLDYTIR